MPLTGVTCSMPGCKEVAMSKVAAPWSYGKGPGPPSARPGWFPRPAIHSPDVKTIPRSPRSPSRSTLGPFPVLGRTAAPCPQLPIDLRPRWTAKTGPVVRLVRRLAGAP